MESDAGGNARVWEFSGPRMKGHREGLKFSRRSLGEYLGVSADTVRFWEYGRNPCPVNMLGGMAALFGITPNDFFRRYRDDEAERYEAFRYQQSRSLPPGDVAVGR